MSEIINNVSVGNGTKTNLGINGLNKDVQNLLWKSIMKSPKADLVLKSLGIMGPGELKVKNVDEEENGCSKGGHELAGKLNCSVEVLTEDDKDIENNCLLETEPEAIAESLETDGSSQLQPCEKKIIDFRGKLYLAPSEWALLRRHSSEDLFGVQICGAYPDTVSLTVELIDQDCTGAGSSLLTKPMGMKRIIEAASGSVEKPITVKVIINTHANHVVMLYQWEKNGIDSFIADIGSWGASAVTIHGRSCQQRYSKLADLDYIYQIFWKWGYFISCVDWNKHKPDCPELSSRMIARSALIKVRNISSGERLNILKYDERSSIEHWVSDTKGSNTTAIPCFNSRRNGDNQACFAGMAELYMQIRTCWSFRFIADAFDQAENG
ncbi:tRNA-dihydrouridine(47) synthase [Salix suchowensis]|nr:tRNA-dihydrouridine(47) synthase [Salix suchowensis]